MFVWRICRERYAREALTGEGARLFGGRWNSRGVRMVYTSTSLALAAIETFVHIEPNLEPDDLVSIQVELPEDLLVERIDPAILPPNWMDTGDESLREIGDKWIVAAKTVALRVPSAAISGEWNLLLNPAHPAFSKITIREQAPFRFDSRMFR